LKEYNNLMTEFHKFYEEKQENREEVKPYVVTNNLSFCCGIT